MAKIKVKNNNVSRTGGLSEARQYQVITEEIQKFTALAKEKGELSIAEINELLPPDIIAPAVLDAFMQGLEVNAVIIIETSENVQELGGGGDSFFSC